MKGRARVFRVSPNASREYLTLTVAQATRTRLETLHRLTGVARGRIADVALAAVEACEDCGGSGVESNGEQTAVCASCLGARIVPTCSSG